MFHNDLESEYLRQFTIGEGEVLKKLESLKVGKSPGPDGIHPKLLYELKNELTAPLTKLYNLSMKMGTVPQEWKDARVSPL
jgi:hypothetical protein